MERLAYLTVLILLLFSLLLSACGGNHRENTDDGEVQLTMSAWGNPAEIKVYQKALDAFMADNPEIKVELVPIPNDGYQDKIMTQLSGGKAPDIFYVGSEWISKIVETGKVVDLSDFLSSDESYVKPDEFAEGLWGAAKINNQIYGLAVDCNPFVLYYNKKVLEEAGVKSPQEYYDEGKWNWDTFAEVTAQIKESGKKGFILDGWSGPLFTWIWTNGGEMYDEDGHIILSENEEAQEAFKYISDMLQQGNFTYSGSLPQGQGGDAMFMSNQVGFVGAGRWYTPMFSENKALEFDYIPYPTNTGEQQGTVSIATAYMVVNKDSKHLDAAMKFASFYTSPEGQKARLEGNGNAVPSVLGADEIITEAEFPEHAGYLLDARNKGRVDDKQSVVPGMDKEIMDIIDLMYLGEQSAEQTIQAVTKKATEMIDEYRNQ
ncbi:ABC transporter substrate-binding protein [Marinicrinis lubricantis]|uniref:ABC transporter substrate-binding protein n=1 Tax=Marinicrinis lubricantis TaxID=2086470 RepID=A0ABW1ILY7_9BACL